MDIAALLREAVNGVPDGDHKAGLLAVVRHVDAAIGHYERAQAFQDDDAFLDSIYRTNQAYEGSLKEAYRVISGKTGNKKRLFDIENFIEESGSFRRLVLQQMKRYRDDYRNPSTHDHKLDFDKNEAILAILSVAAFAKMLAEKITEVSQIESAKSELALPPANISKDITSDEYFNELSNGLLSFLNQASVEGSTERENATIIGAYLEKSLISYASDVYIDSNGWAGEWDIIVEAPSKDKIAFEIKTSRGRQSFDITTQRVSSLGEWMLHSGFRFGFLIEGAARGDPYVRTEFTLVNGIKLHRMGRDLLNLPKG